MDEQAPRAAVEQWKRARVDRLLIDYLLRAGFYRTAVDLAKRQGIEHMSNADVFQKASSVAQALTEQKAAPCLEWLAG